MALDLITSADSMQNMTSPSWPSGFRRRERSGGTAPFITHRGLEVAVPRAPTSLRVIATSRNLFWLLHQD